MNVNRAWELFHNAALFFKVTSMDRREQLTSAAQELCHLLERDRPPEFADEIGNLMASLTCVDPVGAEGSVAATVATLSDEEVVGLAARIVDIENWLSSLR